MSPPLPEWGRSETSRMRPLNGGPPTACALRLAISSLSAGLGDMQLRVAALQPRGSVSGDELVLERLPDRLRRHRAAVRRLADLGVCQLLVPGAIDLGGGDLCHPTDPMGSVFAEDDVGDAVDIELEQRRLPGGILRRGVVDPAQVAAVRLRRIG